MVNNESLLNFFLWRSTVFFKQYLRKIGVESAQNILKLAITYCADIVALWETCIKTMYHVFLVQISAFWNKYFIRFGLKNCWKGAKSSNLKSNKYSIFPTKHDIFKAHTSFNFMNPWIFYVDRGNIFLFNGRYFIFCFKWPNIFRWFCPGFVIFVPKRVFMVIISFFTCYFSR